MIDSGYWALEFLMSHVKAFGGLRAKGLVYLVVDMRPEAPSEQLSAASKQCGGGGLRVIYDLRDQLKFN